MGAKYFEELYLKLRSKENRIYSDEEVFQLPDINLQHEHYQEWLIRKASFLSLKKYLLQKNRALHILDLGCGNGWMTNRLSEINQSHVIGVDVNNYELAQAQRVFAKNKRLNFIEGNIFENIFTSNKKFDCINMSASIQYFKDVRKLISRLFDLLNPDGEIHITCTSFYTNENLEQAKDASLKYYNKMGFDEMAPFYFHHTFDSLAGFNYKLLNQNWGDRLLLKFFKIKKNYFHWIVIKQW